MIKGDLTIKKFLKKGKLLCKMLLFNKPMQTQINDLIFSTKKTFNEFNV